MRGGKYLGAFISGCLLVFSLFVRAPQASAEASNVSSLSASLSGSEVSQTGVTLTLTLVTTGTLSSGSQIAFTLSGSPASFDFTNVTDSNVAASGFTGSGMKSSGGSNTFFIYTLSSDATAGTKTITVSNITNPSTSAIGTVQLSTTGFSGFESGTTSSASVTVGSGGEDNGSGDDGGFDGGEDSGDFGESSVTGDNSIDVTVNDEAGVPLSDVNVFAYCGQSYQAGQTDSNGLATISNMADGNCAVWLSGDYWAEQQSFTFASTGEAKSQSVTFTAEALDTTVRATVTNPDGSAAESIYVFLTDSEGREFSGGTDSNGQVELGVFYGTYTLNGYIGSEESSYYLPETTFTVSSAGISTDGNVYDVEVALQEFDSFITVTQTDSLGAAITNGRLLVYSEAGMRFTQNESDGTITVGVIPGTYTVKAEAEGYANTAQKNVVVNQGETAAVTIAMSDAPNALNLTMVDENGATISADGYVFCKEPDAAFEPAEVYFGFMSDGIVAFTFPDGDFQCSANVTGYVSDNPTFTMSDSETESGEILLTAYDATITVSIEDQDGNTITNKRFGVIGEAADGTTVSAYSMGGSVDVGVIGGKIYKLRAYIMEGGYTSDFNNPVEVTIAAGGSESVTITLYETAGTIDGAVTDANGDVVADATVKATCTTSSGKTFEFSTVSDANGDYTMDVVNGTCTLNSAASDGTALPSGDATEKVSNGESASHDLQLQDSTATLKVTPTTTTATGVTALSVDSGSCYAYNADGVYVTADINADSGKASLSVLAGDWSYGCRVVADDKIKVSATDAIINVAKNSIATAQAEVSSADDNFTNQVAQFSATSDTTFAWPDGTEISVPANALDNSGNVSITASMPTHIASENDLAAGPAIELTARDSNNREITGTFNGDITIKFHYTKSDLAKYGLTEDDLAGGYSYKDGVLAVTDQGYTIDNENNTITVTTNHFSTFTLAGVKAAAPGNVKNLKAKNITTSGAKLTWKTPSSGEVTKYKVQLRKHGVKKTAKWTTYKKVKKTNKVIAELLTDTRYQFRVAACNATGCSDYTDWKAFKTK